MRAATGEDGLAPAQVEILEKTRCTVGEGLIWCARSGYLWWVDIHGQQICRMKAGATAPERWELPGQPGCLALTEGPEILVVMPEGPALFSPESGSLVEQTRVLPGPDIHRANDGTVSGAGRLYFGTMAYGDRVENPGVLYRYDEGGLVPLMGGLHVPNGLAFSPDDRTAYLSDSFPEVRRIWSFDHDPDTGALTGQRLFFDTAPEAGRPDGACIDADGCYWMAGVGGGQLVRVTPAGQVDLRIDLPLRNPTRPCFGGPDLRTLYTTSLRRPGDAVELDGCVMAVRVAQQGLPGAVYRHGL